MIKFVDLELWTIAPNFVSEDAMVSNRTLLGVSSSLHQNRPRPWFIPISKENGGKGQSVGKVTDSESVMIDLCILKDAATVARARRKKELLGFFNSKIIVIITTASFKFTVFNKRASLLVSNATIGYQCLGEPQQILMILGLSSELAGAAKSCATTTPTLNLATGNIITNLFWGSPIHLAPDAKSCT